MKNKILKAFAYTAVAGFFLSICAIDTFHPLAFLIMGLSSSYLILFSKANGWLEA